MQNLPEKYTVQVPKMQGLIIFRQRCTLLRFVSWKLVTSGHLCAMFSKCGFLTLFSRKWLTLIFEFVNFLLVFKNIFWCIYKFSPSENKFDNFNNILAKSAHLWLLLITFIKLIKRQTCTTLSVESENKFSQLSFDLALTSAATRN